MTLSGSNSYSGTTTISAGTLKVTNTGALAGYATSSDAVVVQSSATLAVNAGGAGEWNDANITTLVGLGNVTFNSGSALAIDTTDAGGDFTFSGR